MYYSAELVQEPEPQKDEAPCGNCEEKLLTIIAKYSILAMVGFMDLPLTTINSDYGNVRHFPCLI